MSPKTLREYTVSTSKNDRTTRLPVAKAVVAYCGVFSSNQFEVFQENSLGVQVELNTIVQIV
jgi:hypothetical protein